jgi:hypothetical protein
MNYNQGTNQGMLFLYCNFLRVGEVFNDSNPCWEITALILLKCTN